MARQARKAPPKVASHLTSSSAYTSIIHTYTTARTNLNVALLCRSPAPNLPETSESPLRTVANLAVLDEQQLEETCITMSPYTGAGSTAQPTDDELGKTRMSDARSPIMDRRKRTIRRRASTPPGIAFGTSSSA